MTRSTWTTPSLSTDLNVTPMLDVLLVLLVIFMASVQTRKTIDAQLPETCVGACRDDGTPIVLEVLPGGAYRLNRDPVAAPALAARLRAAYARRSRKVLHVAGHPGARYEDVVRAMDVARGAGVDVLGIPPRESYLPRHR